MMGLHFNMVTEICIVLAVGIAVDYSVHIAHSFLIHRGTRKERALGALQNIGGEVFCGSATSFLAIMGIACTTTYVMEVKCLENNLSCVLASRYCCIIFHTYTNMCLNSALFLSYHFDAILGCFPGVF